VSGQNVRPIRVRFAPSPTGFLHIGGLRVALFNWLFARQQGGVYLLRIEDTDLERSKREYVDSILEAFAWVDIISEEPVAYQTQRFVLYKTYIDRLLDSGKVYWSDPVDEENGQSVIRFRLPKERRQISFNDLIHGPITFDTDQLGGDFVVARSDGTPLYNFVAVVDDTEMRISHVIRGEDHIPNTPKQILLYEALGAAVPEFAHLPLILGPSGEKLSKRDAATSVVEYRAAGFLPDALCNYLVRLGWAHGDQEIFTRDEMKKFFSLDNVNKSGAIFDMAKLRWMNGVYIRQRSAESLANSIHEQVDPDFLKKCSSAPYVWSAAQVSHALELYKERVATLVELRDLVIALHTLPSLLPPPGEVLWNAKSGALLGNFVEHLGRLEELTVGTVERVLKSVCIEHEIPLPVLAKPLRYALTGQVNSPSVYALVVLLGYDEVVRRINHLRSIVE